MSTGDQKLGFLTDLGVFRKMCPEAQGQVLRKPGGEGEAIRRIEMTEGWRGRGRVSYYATMENYELTMALKMIIESVCVRACVFTCMSIMCECTDACTHMWIPEVYIRMSLLFL